ncbi:tautomerase family protein [Amycolatopsis kentuckyensis]|uniref:tautomerase family protein n=1 Tax=Amycolatopsis kentuckyensis TaxID=218823 RepID=UPI0035613B34
MPLLYIDLFEGRTPQETRNLLDTIHEAVVGAFEVPARDRYQVVRMHPPDEIVALDTGLGLSRSAGLVIVHVVSRKRRKADKVRFYSMLADDLSRNCGLRPDDLIVSIVENQDEDWSFGRGRAQFLTGELH